MALCPIPKWNASSMPLSWSSLMSTSFCWLLATEQQSSHVCVAIKCSTTYVGTNADWHLYTHNKVNWQCMLQNCFLGKKITAHWWNKHSWQPLQCSGLWITFGSHGTGLVFQVEEDTARHKIPSLQFVTTHDFQQQPSCISTFNFMKFHQNFWL